MNFKKMVLAAVAMVFAFSAHSGELVKKKDSFAAAAPTNFAMAHAKEGDPCHQSGDIGMSTDGLILSCQSGGKWGKSKAGLNIIEDVSNFGTYTFIGKGGELILVNAHSGGGRWDAVTVIIVNGGECSRSHSNGHERDWIVSGTACVSRAVHGKNTVRASGASRLIVVGN